MYTVKNVIKGIGGMSSLVGSGIALTHMFKEGGLKAETLKVGKITYAVGTALQLTSLLMHDNMTLTEEDVEDIADEIAKEATDFQSDSEE